MTKSLRGRQLVSGFSIIVVGILILGIMLSLSLYQRKTELLEHQLERVALDLLGYLEFSDEEGFRISPNVLVQGKNFIKTNRLDNPEKERFAYIYDLTKEQLVWSALDHNDIEERGIDYTHVFFDFQDMLETNAVLSYKASILHLNPISPSWAQKDPDFDADATYIVAAQYFKYAEDQSYLFIVAETIDGIDKELGELIVIFSILFFVSVVLILIAQLASSFWVVTPIRDFEEEVRSIETGDQEQITGDYPDELVPIRNTINTLISFEKGQKLRFKDSLDDLAHSLKTPLAAIKTSLEGENFVDLPADHRGIAAISGEVERMQEIISRQLRKAMVTSQNAMIISQPIKPVVMRLAKTMKKVHHEKDFEIRVNLDDYAKCRLDQEDLMELLGNLINNACRFCDQLVEISANREDDMLIVDIDDDGMGFPSENPAKLLQRGIREDSKTEGQGIGLAVSTEIVSAVGGHIELLVSPYVGARVRLHLPT